MNKTYPVIPLSDMDPAKDNPEAQRFSDLLEMLALQQLEIHLVNLENRINNMKPCPKCGGKGVFGYSDFQIGGDEFRGAFIQCQSCGYIVSQPTVIISSDFKLFRRWENEER